MRHRDFTAMVDGPTQAEHKHRAPRHRTHSVAVNTAMLREDIAYISWCHDRRVSPDDPNSAAQYERTVGLLYP